MLSPSYQQLEAERQGLEAKASKTVSTASILGGIVGALFGGPVGVGLGAYLGNLIGQNIASKAYGTEMSLFPTFNPQVTLSDTQLISKKFLETPAGSLVSYNLRNLNMK